jgi:hypothetical protein
MMSHNRRRGGGEPDEEDDEDDDELDEERDEPLLYDKRIYGRGDNAVYLKLLPEDETRTTRR